MSSLVIDPHSFDNEIAFCKVDNMKAKQELERIFLRHRISYFVEWGKESFFQKLFSSKDGKISCTIRINRADFNTARELVRGISGVRIRNIDNDDHDAVKDLARKKKLKENIERKKLTEPVIRETSSRRRADENVVKGPKISISSRQKNEAPKRRTSDERSGRIGKRRR